MLKSIPVDEIRRRGSLRDADVAALRAAYDACHEITAEEADTLFALHVAAPIQAPAWAGLFVEIVTDFIVRQSEPDGYIVGQNARWLIDRVSTFGRVETSTELKLLVRVLEAARWCPPTLAAFALDQIRHAVESGKGPLRMGRPVPAGTIAPVEVELAGHIIRGFGSETNVALTRTEAEALLGINRAIAPGGASPAWSELFVRTIGSGVLASLGHAVPPRQEIIDTLGSTEHSAGLLTLLIGDTPAHTGSDRHEGDPGTGACTVWHSARLLTPEEHALVRLERQRLEIVTNEVIEETTGAWLMDRLARGRSEDDNEAALLAYVVREASRLSPELARFAEHRSAAA
jgi:hypothetical protein